MINDRPSAESLSGSIFLLSLGWPTQTLRLYLFWHLNLMNVWMLPVPVQQVVYSNWAGRKWMSDYLRTSGLLLADVSVRSPRQLFIFIIYNNLSWIKVQKMYHLIPSTVPVPTRIFMCHLHHWKQIMHETLMHGCAVRRTHVHFETWHWSKSNRVTGKWTPVATHYLM